MAKKKVGVKHYVLPYKRNAVTDDPRLSGPWRHDATSTVNGSSYEYSLTSDCDSLKGERIHTPVSDETINELCSLNGGLLATEPEEHSIPGSWINSEKQTWITNDELYNSPDKPQLFHRSDRKAISAKKLKDAKKTSTETVSPASVMVPSPYKPNESPITHLEQAIEAKQASKAKHVNKAKKASVSLPWTYMPGTQSGHGSHTAAKENISQSILRGNYLMKKNHNKPLRWADESSSEEPPPSPWTPSSAGKEGDESRLDSSWGAESEGDTGESADSACTTWGNYNYQSQTPASHDAMVVLDEYTKAALNDALPVTNQEKNKLTRAEKKRLSKAEKKVKDRLGIMQTYEAKWEQELELKEHDKADKNTSPGATPVPHRISVEVNPNKPCFCPSCGMSIEIVSSQSANGPATPTQPDHGSPQPHSNPPVSYHITYCAKLEFEGKTAYLAIDKANIFGLEKKLLEGSMTKIWKWVQDKKLTDKIALQDALDLAKAIDDEKAIKPDGSSSRENAEPDTPGSQQMSPDQPEIPLAHNEPSKSIIEKEPEPSKTGRHIIGLEKIKAKELSKNNLTPSPNYDETHFDKIGKKRGFDGTIESLIGPGLHPRVNKHPTGAQDGSNESEIRFDRNQSYGSLFLSRLYADEPGALTSSAQMDMNIFNNNRDKHDTGERNGISDYGSELGDAANNDNCRNYYEYLNSNSYY